MIRNRLFTTIAILSTAFILQTAHAEYAQANAAGMHAGSLPDVDRKALVNQLETLRSQLIERKQALLEIVADRKLDGNDALITAILPGGLIYASYKKVRYDQARDELSRVSAEIEEYAADLRILRSWSEPVAVAQLP